MLKNGLSVANTTLEHMMLIIGALDLLLWDGTFMQTYSKVLKFQLANNYAKRESFEKLSKRIVFSKNAHLHNSKKQTENYCAVKCGSIMSDTIQFLFHCCIACPIVL